MKRMSKVVIIGLILLSLSFAACSKGGSEVQQVSPEEAKKNAELERTAPHAAPTIRGSVERIHLAVSSAGDSYRYQKWSDVVSYLNTARQETEKALADPTVKDHVMREALGETKAALDRIIETAENRSGEAEGQLRELQTRVGNLKSYLPPLQEPQP